MKKRWLASLLVVALTVLLCQGASLTNVATAATSSQYKKETMILTGIMEGYSLAQAGSSSKVTRAQFAKMLVNASSFQGQAETSLKTSLFKDVSYKNQYAGYIKIAVEQGWMTANVKGKFLPNSAVTVKDAAKATLAMLGYQKADFSGNLVNAQVAKFNSLGLNDNIKKTKNQTLTFANCTNLFYKLLGTKGTNGSYYGSSLGYTIGTDGNINYLTLLQEKLDGPVLMTSALSDAVPFSTTSATVYLNEKKSDASALSTYDVLYYSKALKTIWAYNEKVTGTIESISPNRTSPESVTIGGTTYSLGNQDMVFAFSSLGEYSLYDTVTLFLGMDDKAVAALDTAQYSADLYGVVLDYGIALNEYNNTATNRYLTMVDYNGNQSMHYYNYGELSISEGDLIHVTYSAGIKTLVKASSSTSALEGKTVNASARTIGSYTISPSAKIVDVHPSAKSSQLLSLDRIDGVTLSSYNVYYYKTNDAGEITALMLKNVSSGTYEYGVITDITDKNNMTVYEYLVGGQKKTTTVDDIQGDMLLDVGSRIDYQYDSDDVLESITFHTLTGAAVTEITSSSVKTTGWTKTIDSKVDVYYVDGEGDYIMTTVSKVKDLTKYKLTAYYDSNSSVSKAVRIIIAKPR